ncbi:hypothetical protein H2200_008315 [Cladophialophora chaetospira]|uniref:Chromo domain-containing protein n=1 Tax=Cladophialophora chaetospira TaxID=386627 RepID=A0AA38X5J5_9EURO|nr:hypothetical protein H2200_008315 [Cladophialophora chaetospira]
MPRLAGEQSSDHGDEYADAVAETDSKANDNKANKQINGELKDKVDEEEDEQAVSTAKDDADAEEDEEMKVKAKGEEEEDDEEGDEGEEYIVESIADHRTTKKDVLYLIKWQGYPEEQNTWEPEEHLLPHSRKVLAAYHKKIGGPPQLPLKRPKSKQSLCAAASSEDLPATKRQKRNGAKDEDVQDDLGTWLPKGNHWEDEVEKVDTIERNEETDQLMAYVKFKNGKRTKITMDMVYKHCPRPMLKFYEEHLKFK